MQFILRTYAVHFILRKFITLNNFKLENINESLENINESSTLWVPQGLKHENF